jgi:tRNA pseudouridine(55) synthase
MTIVHRSPLGYHPVVERYALYNKSEGETPLMALERYRVERGIARTVPLTYAGRLDPMASGALIILAGDECKRKDAYTALDKTYEFEILFGATTDTGDILGMLQRSEPVSAFPDVSTLIAAGTYRLPYPAYSSKTVGGKPLFKHALDNTLGTVSIPQTDMTVREVAFLGARTVQAAHIIDQVIERISKISDGAVNDFRKPKILSRWHTLQLGAYMIARYRATVSSGTYIRAIAEAAGRAIELPALAFSIARIGFSVPPHGDVRILCTDTREA